MKPTLSTISVAVVVALATSCLAAPAAGVNNIEKRAVNPTAQAHAYNGHASARKQALIAMGADSLDLSVAMLETGQALSGQAYPYGDGKSSDAANFGLFKNNWYMIRTYCSQFKGQTAAQFNNGAVLNKDDAAAVRCQNEQRKAVGDAAWFRGQRNGVTGMNGGDTQDINNYKNAVYAIKSYVDAGHTTDDMLTWISVGAI